MIFNSIIFIFVFLPVFLGIYYITPVKVRKIMLLILSIFFLSWGAARYLILYLVSVLFNYLLTVKMDSVREKHGRKNFLTIIVTFNVLILFVFKYLEFTLGNINAITGSSLFVQKLVQPLGLSFYTFQALSYVFDVYYGKYRAEKNPVNLSMYLLMFPQLLSGPIMRYNDLKPQMDKGLINFEGASNGVERFITGLFKKVFIANTMAQLWAIIKAMDPSSISVLTAWTGIFAFTFYIYFDFSGYMDMAIGVASMFGYRLNENFNYPYASKTVSEFWRRWHMTLGTWFRDYIYIPMGGSREGNLRLVINTMAVWLITGLWHGAGWNFIIWGAYLGVVILCEKFFLKNLLEKVPPILSNIYTMIMIMIGWVFFDVRSVPSALKYIKKLFGGGVFADNTGIYYLYTYLFVFILAFILSNPIPKNLVDAYKAKMNRNGKYLMAVVLLLMFILSVAFLLSQSYSPSMYIGF